MFRRSSYQPPPHPQDSSQSPAAQSAQPENPADDYGVRSLGSIASGWNGLDSGFLGQSAIGNPGLGMDLSQMLESEDDEQLAGEQGTSSAPLVDSAHDSSPLLGGPAFHHGLHLDQSGDADATPLHPMAFATLHRDTADDPVHDRGRPSQSAMSSPMSMHSLPTSMVSSSISSFSHSRTVSPAESSDVPVTHPLPTRSYVFSRTHWAVEEARKRTQEQGDDLSLVLPTLKLPSSSLLLDQSANREQGDLAPIFPSAAHNPTAHRLVHILLCGTNRTVNAFLRSLLQDGRLRLFRLKEKGRSKDGVYDVGVFLRKEMADNAAQDRTEDNGLQLDLAAASGTASPAECLQSPTMPYLKIPESDLEKTLRPPADTMVAKIRVVGKGQDGNLSRAIADVESTFKRLNDLLHPYLPSDDQGRQDLHDLVELWIEKSKGTGQGQGRNGDGWYDLGILTGDARFLAGRDRELLNRFAHMLPTVCHPETLQDRLTPYLQMPFYTLTPRCAAEASAEVQADDELAHLEDPTPICEKPSPAARCYFEATNQSPRPVPTVLADMLVDPVKLDCNLREEKVQSFLRWKSSTAATNLESSHHSQSTAPVPTIARNQAISDWEANLSRRHAARAHSKPSHRSSGSLGAALERQTTAPPNFFGNGAWRSAHGATKSPSWTLRLWLSPLSGVSGHVGTTSEEKGGPSAGMAGKGLFWAAVACVTFVAGYQCYLGFSSR